MWPLAAEPVDISGVLISAVWTFLGIVVATLGTIAVAGIKARADRKTAQSTPPTTSDSGLLMQLAKEQGALVQRTDDHDESIDLVDRATHNNTDRIEALERYNDHRDPYWRDR